MIKKVVAALVILGVVSGIGLSLWARAALSTDTVRTALADQLSKALGQPVTVDAVSARILPRLTVSLTGVAIGQPARIRVASLDVATDVRALLSRRIEHAALHIDQARLELPLPPLKFATGAADGGGAAVGAPVQLVSIDEVVLTGVEFVSRGRTLRGDIEVVPHGTSALTIRRFALVADGARIDATGEISDLSGPVGTLDLKAGALDLDELAAFASDFAEGSAAAPVVPGGPSRPGASTPAPVTSGAGRPSVDLSVTLAAERATMAGLSLEAVSGRARLRGETLSVEPMAFTIFGGRYEGQMGATLGTEPTFSWKAALSNVDMAAVVAFAGNPGVLTGRLTAQLDVAGAGIDAASAMRTARGTATLSIANGVVKNLALMKSAVAATSLDPQAVIAASQESHDEAFSELGARLAIANGAASSQDLHFVSKDLRFTGGGALRLDGSALRLTGAVQLSEELSKQASSTLVRVTQEDGRITLPTIIRGEAAKYSIEIDTAALARRGVTNEAKSQAQSALKKGLRLLGR